MLEIKSSCLSLNVMLGHKISITAIALLRREEMWVPAGSPREKPVPLITAVSSAEQPAQPACYWRGVCGTPASITAVRATMMISCYVPHTNNLFMYTVALNPSHHPTRQGPLSPLSMWTQRLREVKSLAQGYKSRCCGAQQSLLTTAAQLQSPCGLTPRVTLSPQQHNF